MMSLCLIQVILHIIIIIYVAICYKYKREYQLALNYFTMANGILSFFINIFSLSAAKKMYEIKITSQKHRFLYIINIIIYLFI